LGAPAQTQVPAQTEQIFMSMGQKKFSLSNSKILLKNKLKEGKIM
jgi:hypothetical protein